MESVLSDLYTNNKNSKERNLLKFTIKYIEFFFNSNTEKTKTELIKLIEEQIKKDSVNVWSGTLTRCSTSHKEKKVIDSYLKNDLLSVLNFTLKVTNKLKSFTDITQEDILDILKDIAGEELIKNNTNFIDKNNIVKIQIEVENIKNITSLLFKIDVRENLIGIIGENGCGKSTLLTCLSKVIVPDIIRKEFKGNDIDFEGSSISYKFTDINGKTSTFKWIRKGGWICDEGHASDMPKLKGIFESNVFFGERFTKPFDKLENSNLDIKQNSIDIKYSEQIAKNLGVILYDKTNIFNAIRVYEHAESNGNKSFKEYFIYKNNNENPISQIDWSSGEYLLFKILEYVVDLENSKKDKTKTRLIIIDEIELSLHPLAQTRMIKYLKKLSKSNNLLIILTTHSPYIIKEINESNIYALDKKNDINIIQEPPVFTGNLISELTGNNYYDRLILVEDDMALLFIENILEKYLITYPKYKIIPIGGYEKVLEMIKLNNKNTIFNSDKVIAILDGDVSNIIQKRIIELNNDLDGLSKDNNEIDKDIKILDDEVKELRKNEINHTKEDFDKSIKNKRNSISKLNDYKVTNKNIKILKYYQKFLENTQSLNHNSFLYLPIDNIEGYTRDVLLKDNNFISNINRRYNLDLDQKYFEEYEKKIPFKKLLEQIKEENKYFSEMNIVEVISERLDKEYDNKYFKFKDDLLKFFNI